MQRKYYEAYDDRYRQIHKQDLQWFHDEPSEIVMETIQKYSIGKEKILLEIGCGEGRDAFPVLEKGYNLLATDISKEAVKYCKRIHPEYGDSFQVLDCVNGTTKEKFDFIYAVAVIHMLVDDQDRNAFYSFIREHLCAAGIALICTMGDGQTERRTDTKTAFDLQDRIHEQTGKHVKIASTTCRMVNFQTFSQELARNGLEVIEEGITSIEPDFTQMMYAVVKQA